MIEYIDKHATAEHIDMYAKLLTMGDYRSGMMKAKEILLIQESEDVTPTAPKIIRGTDIVQVVRCGQCRYCTNNCHSSIYDECGRTGAYVSEDDYCSKGEKDDS